MEFKPRNLTMSLKSVLDKQHQIYVIETACTKGN